MDGETRTPRCVDDAFKIARCDAVALHPGAQLDDHATTESERSQGGNVVDGTHGVDGIPSERDRTSVINWCQDEGSGSLWDVEELIDRPHRDLGGQLHGVVHQDAPTEPVAIALDHRNEGVELGGDPPNVGAPGRSVDHQPQSHRPQRYRASFARFEIRLVRSTIQS